VLSIEPQSVSKFFDRGAMPETPSCWRWLGPKDKDGYGRFYCNPRITTQAHRWIYQLVNGELPPDLEVDHLCKTRQCTNPDHLEAVTRAVNNYRRWNRDSATTHCLNGHPYNEANTYAWRNRRVCRTCNNVASHKYHHGKRKNRAALR
jgi:hypothetical protein